MKVYISGRKLIYEAQNDSEYSKLTEFIKNYQERLDSKKSTSKSIPSTTNSSISSIPSNWRDDVVHKLREIGDYEGSNYRVVTNRSYLSLQKQSRCNLNSRLNSLVVRRRKDGLSKSKLRKLNNLDVIGDDQSLTRLYINIVNSMHNEYLRVKHNGT